MFKICKGIGSLAAFWTAIALLGVGAFATGEVVGEAYWGSFGERSARIEGVLLKTESNGVFIGFDEESEIAAYAFEVDWNSEEKFVLKGFSRSEQSPESFPTRGTGRTLASNDGPLLESDLEEIDLAFEAFEKSHAKLSRYRLEGETEGEVMAVIGEDGRAYALYLGDGGYVYGGEAKVESGTTIRFQTNRGDIFEGIATDSLDAYRLADGQRGRMTEAPAESIDSGSIALASLWSYSVKAAGSFSDSLHLILAGSGSTDVSFEAVVRGDIRDEGWSDAESAMKLEVFRLDEDGEWQFLLESSRMIRVKTQSRGEFETIYSVRLPMNLGEGTYLAQLGGLEAFEAEIEIAVEIEPSDSLRAVNGSVFYYCDGQSSDHRLGFELSGEGVVSSLVRNVGPGLDYFEMPDGTRDPSFAIYRDESKLWKCDDWFEWGGATSVESRAAELGAFPLSEDSADAALALSLGAGRYETVARGRSDRLGFEILEFYCAAN